MASTRGESTDAGDADVSDIRSFFQFFWREWLNSPSRYRALEEESGVPRSAQVILHRLYYDGPMIASDLARALMLDRSTISRQLKPLRDIGALEPGEGDDRRAKLALSDTGRAIASRIDALIVRDYNAALRRMDPARRAVLAELLNELRAGMEEAVQRR